MFIGCFIFCEALAIGVLVISLIGDTTANISVQTILQDDSLDDAADIKGRVLKLKKNASLFELMSVAKSIESEMKKSAVDVNYVFSDVDGLSNEILKEKIVYENTLAASEKESKKANHIYTEISGKDQVKLNFVGRFNFKLESNDMIIWRSRVKRMLYKVFGCPKDKEIPRRRNSDKN